MSYKNKGVFVVFVHSIQHDDYGRQQMQERCEFVDRLKNRHIANATVILELEEGRFVKNRTDHKNFDDFIKHVRDSYPNEFNSLLKLTDLEEKYSLTTQPEDGILLDEVSEET